MKISKLFLVFGAMLALGAIIPFAANSTISFQTIAAFADQALFSDAGMITSSILLIVVALLVSGIHSKRHQLSRTLDKLKRTLGRLQDNNIYATS